MPTLDELIDSVQGEDEPTYSSSDMESAMREIYENSEYAIAEEQFIPTAVFISITETNANSLLISMRCDIESLCRLHAFNEQEWIPSGYSESSKASNTASIRDSELVEAPVVSDVDTDKCPVCGGEVKEIWGNSMFCLDCDWDNIPQLSP